MPFYYRDNVLEISPMSMEELKPCPFCGYLKPNLRTSVHDLPSTGVAFKEPIAVVTCPRCCAAAGFFKIGKLTEAQAMQRAVEHWNMRDYEEEEE